ncbi:hypothetical protein V2J09_022637 [Rumex salicifolius]
MSISCPQNSIVYNDTLCECSPGYFLSLESSESCTLFNVSPSEWVVNSGVDYAITFPTTIFSFDRIKRFTQSQAVFLEATVVLLFSWLLFCGLVRLGKLGDGTTLWYRVRCWITRLDVCFATRHWLDDQNVVTKRRTELGGTFSMASCILFIGLFAALLYQIISKRKIEVHNVRAANAPDLVSFVNDLEFNITTISNMSCSQLRGLGTLLVANPGFIGFRAADLSKFANYSCHNTSNGPMISLRCSNCPLTWDNIYISWHFVDIPNNPATSVGFQFNLTAKNAAHKRHVSTVSGRVNNASGISDQPITFRGENANILQFNLFPRIYRNFHHGLKLLQPLFHEFLPGSFISDAADLQSSLQISSNGMINTTLFINFLSDYLVEIDNQNIFGPVGCKALVQFYPHLNNCIFLQRTVSFLADLGGLYCISLGIFYYLLVQCEYRIKRLRNEDKVFKEIKMRRKAQARWSKLRKFVFFTWGSKALQQDIYIADRDGASCGSLPFTKKGSSRKNFKDDEANNAVLDIQRSIQSLYEYNMVLRDELVEAQSKIEALASQQFDSGVDEEECSQRP